jgi:hypothetical protein
MDELQAEVRRLLHQTWWEAAGRGGRRGRSVRFVLHASVRLLVLRLRPLARFAGKVSVASLLRTRRGRPVRGISEAALQIHLDGPLRRALLATQSDELSEADPATPAETEESARL